MYLLGVRFLPGQPFFLSLEILFIVVERCGLDTQSKVVVFGFSSGAQPSGGEGRELLPDQLSKACGIDDGLDVLPLTEVHVVFVDCAARKTHPFFIVVVELQPFHNDLRGMTVLLHS
jgi:hypothetical protein